MVTQRRRLRRRQPIGSDSPSTQPGVLTISPPIPTTMSNIPAITISPSQCVSISPAEPQAKIATPQTIIATLGTTTSTISTKQDDRACSHLTVTRLYTTEHVCSVCYQVGAFGWLYRCTQDSELLIEHDIKNGAEVVSDNHSQVSGAVADLNSWIGENRRSL